MNCRVARLVALAVLLPGGAALARVIEIDPGLHHLRAGEPREWREFPARSEAAGLSVSFKSESNAAEWALRLRQQDVKQTWRVLLNGKEIGRLVNDENDQVIYLAVPAGGLRPGENQLRIEQNGRTPDDIRVGEILLDERPVKQVL